MKLLMMRGLLDVKIRQEWRDERVRGKHRGHMFVERGSRRGVARRRLSPGIVYNRKLWVIVKAKKWPDLQVQLSFSCTYLPYCGRKTSVSITLHNT